MKTTISEVRTRKELKAFVHFPNELYKDNVFYVPQIEFMDLDTLDPKKNHAFEVCEGKYWLAKDENGRVVGRIAGIINRAYNEKVGEKICRFGWLDFIEDEDVLKALISTVETYAAQKGMNVMNGPVGFLEFDASGVLVEGFDQIPTPYGKYNAPYYDPMLKALGYEKDIDWVEYVVDISNFDYERNHRAAALISERYGIRNAEFHNHREIEKYLDGLFDVMNRCYDKLHGYSKLTPGQLDDLKKQFLPNVDEDLLSIVVDKNDKVVGFMYWIPSLSLAMQKAGGKLFPFGWVHILKAMKHNDTVNSLLVAVDPALQSKGMIALFFDKVYSGVSRIGARYIETTRELENNHNVINLAGKFEKRLSKVARCYRRNL